MSHHLSTPDSILNAPTRAVQVISAQRGLSRSERRNGVRWPAADFPSPLKHSAMREASAAGRNAPHVRTTPRRGRKVRRAGVAR